jgi:spermidine synthase
MIKVRRVIYSGKTRYQDVDILDTYPYGLCFVLDGKIQSTSLDEWVYHESLVHPPMLAHPNPREVLIVGGGEGSTLREVLKHRPVQHVVMVDIDEEVIALAKQYLGEFHQGAFDDPRTELVIADGREYLSRVEDGRFDLVIVDITDPLAGGPSYKLFTKEFYTLVKRKLGAEGVMVTQATSTSFSEHYFASIYKTVEMVFPVARAYHVFMKSYTAMWGFVVGSKGPDPARLTDELIAERLKSRGLEGLRFYSPRTHHIIFALPPDLERLMEAGQVATDDRPIEMPV